MAIKSKLFSGLFNRNKRLESIEKRIDEIQKRGGDALLDIPLPFNSYVQMVGQNEKTPLYRWSYRWLMDMYYGSDLLRTIVKTITDEAFKNGLDIKENFVSKCTNVNCQYEMYEDKDRCPICGALTRPPSYEDKRTAENFIRKHNRFDESFVETMRIADNDLNVFDNAFILLAKRYMYDEDGKIVGAQIEDVVRLSPDKMKLIISNYGMGRDDNGRYAYFCPEHREKLVVKAYAGEYRCDECGKELIPCWYASSSSGSSGASTVGQLIYYGQNEVYHLKRWTNTEGYGTSPLYSVWRKVLTLIKMDDMTMEAYSLERSPRTLLILRGKREAIRQAWEWVMQKARENPNFPFPLVIEGTDEHVKRVVEKVDFDLKPQEMQMLDMIEKFRQYVGLVYGVSPIFSEGASGQGLQNEGLQITVTNRTIAETQRVWNDFLRWLGRQINVLDYTIELHRNEIQEDLTKLDIERQRIQNAKLMTSMGYETEMYLEEDGTINFKYHKVELKPREPGTPNSPTLEGGGTGVEEELPNINTSQDYDRLGSITSEEAEELVGDERDAGMVGGDVV